MLLLKWAHLHIYSDEHYSMTLVLTVEFILKSGVSHRKIQFPAINHSSQDFHKPLPIFYHLQLKISIIISATYQRLVLQGFPSQIEHLDFAMIPKGHLTVRERSRWIDGHMIVCSHHDKLLLLALASFRKLRRIKTCGYLLKGELLNGFGERQCFQTALNIRENAV